MSRQGPPKPPDWVHPRDRMKGEKGSDLQWSLRTAEVVRVDYQNLVCDLRFLDREGVAREVPITSAFWSKRGFVGAMPEEGAIAVCGMHAVHEDWLQPIILSFLPNGFKTAMRFHPFGPVERDSEDALEKGKEALQNEFDGFFGVTRHKFRKLYPGDVYLTSSKGSEAVLDEDVRLLDRTGGTFRLRAEDQTSIISSVDFRMATAAARFHSGRVVRNGLFLPVDLLADRDSLPDDHPLFDPLVQAGLLTETGEPAPGVNDLPHVVTESGRKVAFICPLGEHPQDPDVTPYTENRVEIQEFADQTSPVQGEEGFDADRILDDGGFDPFIEKVTGTVIGNDPYTLKGRSRYGEVLRPIIFTSKEATSGKPRLEVVDDERPDAGGRKAAAGLYRMKRPDSDGELFFAHDKEGRVFVSIPASSSGPPLGGGRSLEADLKGSAKITTGANERNESLDLDTAGSANINLGTEDEETRSLNIRTDGGVRWDIRGPSSNGRAIDVTAQGDVKRAVDGDVDQRIAGGKTEVIDRSLDIDSQSRDVSVGQGGSNYTVIADHQENIKGQHSQSVGQGRSSTIYTPSVGGATADKLTIMTGTRKERFVAPTTDTTTYVSAASRTVQATAAMNCTWQAGGAGNFSFQAPSGAFTVSLGGGAISLTTGGAITMQAGGTIQMTSTNIGLTGTVGLGAGVAAPLPVVTGVPGPSPYIDPITGIPATGNPLVRSV